MVVKNYKSTTEVIQLVDSDGLEAVNVRIPDELLRVIDGLVKKGVFSSRAEAIREFLREYALESRQASSISTSNSNSTSSISKRGVSRE